MKDNSSGTTIVNRGYSRTDNLNLTGIADNVTTGNTESYSYTPSNRLQNGSGAYGALTDSYDGVGNRIQEVLGSTTNVYNYPSGSNLLSSISQGGSTVRSLGYDGAGNIVSDSRSGTAYAYTYNNRNRLSQVSVASVVQANYVYDGLERLAIRTTQNMTPSGTTHYVYDLSGRILSEATSSGTIQTEYVWVDDLPLAVFANLDTQTPSQWYVHPDHLNRPVRMTDSSETLVWDAVYWPFGAVYSVTGSAVNNLRFPGQYYLLEAGLHYNWYRHYDPMLGRYTQPDPGSSLVTSNAPVIPPVPVAMTPIIPADPLSAAIQGVVLSQPELPGDTLGLAPRGSPLQSDSYENAMLPEFVDGPSLYAYAKSTPIMKVDPKGLQAGASSSAGSQQMCFLETCPLKGSYMLPNGNRMCVYVCTLQGVKIREVPGLLPCPRGPFSPHDF